MQNQHFRAVLKYISHKKNVLCILNIGADRHFLEFLENEFQPVNVHHVI